MNSTEQTLRPSPAALLNPRCDPIFKAMFTQDTTESNFALQDFISTVLGKKVTNLQLQPNEPPVIMPDSMQMSFDVSVRFDDGEYADIEMQSQRQDYDYGARAEIQVARLMSVNAKRGSRWMAKKVYQISVIDFEYKKDDKSPLSWYTMRDRMSGKLGDRLNVIFLDLVKIRRLIGTPVDKLTKLEKWGLYFACADNAKHQQYIDKIVKSEEGLMAANFTVGYMSKEEANWFRQNSYDIAMRDRNEAFYNATQRGLKQGREQGLAQGKREQALQTAKNLLQTVLTDQQIADATALSLEEVQALRV